MFLFCVFCFGFVLVFFAFVLVGGAQDLLGTFNEPTGVSKGGM